MWAALVQWASLRLNLFGPQGDAIRSLCFVLEGRGWDRLWDRFGGKVGHFGLWNPVGSSGIPRIYKGFRLPRGFLR
jgi:hypothetical protein